MNRYIDADKVLNDIECIDISDCTDIINRQQAEIERLKIENQALRMAANSYKSHYNEAKVEAVRAFAERLKDDAYVDDGYCCDIVLVAAIDGILKEMTGETE